VPTDELRAMVPSDDKHAFLPPPVYPIDRDLVQFSEIPALKSDWNKHYEEGRKIMREFNLQLASSIKTDKDMENMSGDSRNLKRKFDVGSGSGRQAEEVKRKFVETWFPAVPGFMGEEYKQTYLRASAWYKVGYEAGKPTFAWLGARCLNGIKSFVTNGNMPGLTIGALLNMDDSASVRSVAESSAKIDDKNKLTNPSSKSSRSAAKSAATTRNTAKKRLVKASRYETVI